MSTFTTSLHLELVNFNISTWHDQVNGNFTILDAAFRALTNLITQGAWTNNTAYTIGQNVVDTIDGRIWTVKVNHTSAAAPTTFAADRLAHPTFWQLFTASVANRGVWTTATAYNVNDFVSDNNRFGVVVTAYTSGASYNVDVAGGKIVTLLDLTAYVTGGIGQSINVASSKATPVGADKFGYANSADSFNLVSFTYTQLLAAIFASPTMTGSPIAPSQLITDDSTKVATTAFVDDKCEVQRRTNLIVNPAMQISQENGNTAGGTSGYYAADEWSSNFVTSAGVLSFQRVQVVTPYNSANRIRLSVATADVALVAGEYCMIRHVIEGLKAVPLQWGTATAKDLLVRFGFKGPAGTYAVSVRNSAANRCYVREFTISGGQANTDTSQSLTFPGDTAGTWLKDTGIGIALHVVVAAGSTAQTTPNAWQASSAVGTASTSNGLGLNTNVFELFDVEAYCDSEGIGGVTAWTPPSVDEQFKQCQRYYQGGTSRWDGNALNAITHSSPVWYKVVMRATPTVTETNLGNTNFPATPAHIGGTAIGHYTSRIANATGGGLYSENFEAIARL